MVSRETDFPGEFVGRTRQGEFVGRAKDFHEWWDATIIEDNKNLRFSVNYTMKDTHEGWEEHDVDISRLHRTELGPEPANDGAVERDRTSVLQLAATNEKWPKYWSCDWLETHATGAQWPTGMRQDQWGKPTVCPQWLRFLDTPLDEVLAMLELRPEWAKDDDHCQFRAIGGAVFGETSLEAAI